MTNGERDNLEKAKVEYLMRLATHLGDISYTLQRIVEELRALRSEQADKDG
jgi:hypothetical protein